MPFKQVILVRSDLKLSPGKLAVQAAHASVEAVLTSPKTNIAAWRKEGMKKIVLSVNNLDELRQHQQSAENKKLAAALITDAGRTEIEPGTITCLAIGPDDEKKIDEITGKLKLLH